MWSLLIEPVTFLDHLKGSECLLCLIVVIELPRQIADEKQEKAHGSNDPNGAPIFKQASCHVEPSRLALRNFMRRRKTSLNLLKEIIIDWTRSSPDSLAATLAAQPSMSLAPLAPFLHFGRNDNYS